MAQARRRARQAGSGGGLPGWAMLTIGLIIGLFVAFLVYLDDLQEPPTAAVRQADEENPDRPSVAGAEAAGEAAEDKPRFEFYSILPELEVVVPDEPGTPAERPPESEDRPGDAAGTGAPAPAAPGTFYLQAGSFQKADQADRMKARIALLGLDVEIQSVSINGERWHRVRVGPYTEKKTLRSAQQRLRDNDIDYLVLREKSSG